MRPTFANWRAHIAVVTLERGLRNEVRSCMFEPISYSLQEVVIVFEFKETCKEVSIKPEVKGYYMATFFPFGEEPVYKALSILDGYPKPNCFESILGDCKVKSEELVLTLGIGANTNIGQIYLVSWFPKKDLVQYGYSLDYTMAILRHEGGEIDYSKLEEGIFELIEQIEYVEIDKLFPYINKRLIVPIRGYAKGNAIETLRYWYIDIYNTIREVSKHTCERNITNCIVTAPATEIVNVEKGEQPAASYAVAFNGLLYRLLKDYDIIILEPYTMKGCKGFALVGTKVGMSGGEIILGASTKAVSPCRELSLGIIPGLNRNQSYM